MTMSINFTNSADEVLQRACRYYRDQDGTAVAALASAKLEILRHYDIPGMERAVAICFWGRSGSILLASYLDGHDDVVMLPMLDSHFIYHFFHDYKTLSVWEKLIAYPAYAEQFSIRPVTVATETPNKRWSKWGRGPFFGGDWQLTAADYYAAVHALFTVFGDRPAAWLDTRKRFFQLLHVAGALAIGRRPGNPRPLMVYSLHFMNDEMARHFVEDFPSARIIHTIRDPISSFDSWFDHELRVFTSNSSIPHPGYLKVAFDTVRHLLASDGPHWGMEPRTRAVRFEDLHLAPEETMRRVANWLGIPYRLSLLESTFSGAPYVVESGGDVWTGANPANARRRSKNLDLADRLMLFALLQENFVAWNYPSPRVFRNKWIRLATIAALLLLPMKMEMVSARTVMRLQVIPCLRSGRIGFACRAVIRLVVCRWSMMRRVVGETRQRLVRERQLLELL